VTPTHEGLLSGGPFSWSVFDLVVYNEAR
jgi:hypothetical protein